MRTYTVEEYLALEEQARYKSEYCQGEIHALAGGSADHNRLASNMNAELNVHLRGTECESFTSDMRIAVEAHDLYTYPDAAVVCGELVFVAGRNDTITNPTVIVEVLSLSTRDYDRGQKFEFYRSLGSLREYVLIHQERAYGEIYSRNSADRWVFAAVDGLDATLALQSIAFELPLRRLYERADWATAGDG